MSERILKDADQASREEPGERIAAGCGKADGDEQRKIEDGEEAKAHRQPRLEKDGGKRNKNGCGEAEAVNLNLLARCVSDGHVIVECPRLRASLWAGWLRRWG